MKRILAVMLLSVLTLTGCGRKDQLVWSPDGKKLALTTSDGVRVGDETGKLNKPIERHAKFCRWLPDSKSAVVVSRKAITTWPEVKEVLSTSEQMNIVRLANKTWKTGYMPVAKTNEAQQQQNEALIYLSQRYGAKLVKARLPKVLKAHCLCLSFDCLVLLDLSTDEAVVKKTIWRTTQDIGDVRISPNGTLVAVCIESDPLYKIVLVPLNGSKPITVVKSLADCPDWSRDGRSIFYIAYSPLSAKTPISEMQDTTKRPFLATLNSLEVADMQGKIYSKPGNPKLLIDAFAADVSRVRCMPDGSVVFHAKSHVFPSIKNAEPKSCLYRLSADRKSLEPIAGSEQLPGDDMRYFEPNQDGSMIAVPGSNGEILVIDTVSGVVTTLEKKGEQELVFAPQWRTADELCYPSRNVVVSPGGHNVDVVLQSMKDLSRRVVISKEWSAISVDFLQDPKESETEKDKAPVRKKPIKRRAVRKSQIHSNKPKSAIPAK